MDVLQDDIVYQLEPPQEGHGVPQWLQERCMSALWTVLIGISGWSVHKVRRERAVEIKHLNTARPDTIRFTSKGITLDGPDGATAFLPWGHFTGWREGRRVLVLNRSSANPVIVSVARLSDTERHSRQGFPVGAHSAVASMSAGSSR